jgi:hypothetical protein
METSTATKHRNAQKAYIKNRIEQLLGEILSDKYECRVVLKFEKSNEKELSAVTCGTAC